MKIRSMTGWFVLLAALVFATGALGPVAARGAQPDAAGEPVMLRLKYSTFDPLQGEPQIDSALHADAYPGTGEGAYIVQFEGPVQEVWKDRVTSLGGLVMDYLPDYAFLVWMDGAARQRVAALDAVRWVGLYQPAYKLSPNLDRTNPLYRVVLFEGADLAAVEARLAELNTPTREVPGELFVLVLPEGGAEQIATWPEVLWIESSLLPQVSNNVATGIMAAPTAWSTGYTGLGQKVTVADTGIDTGLDAPGVADMHADFDDRFKTEPASETELKSYPIDPTWPTSCVANVGADDGADDEESGHGTHVLGSVLGNGAASGGTIKGTAYEATPTFQAVQQWTAWIGSCTGKPPYALTGLPADGDFYAIFEDAYNLGSRVHSNSWGSPYNGEYTVGSRSVDQFVWDHPDMLILFSAGNWGTDSQTPQDGYVDEDSLDAPGTAKNALTVGASDNERDSGGYSAFTWGFLDQYAPYNEWPLPPTSSDQTSDNPAELAAFSSRGPANDGRLKPDVVAPGTNILSTRSSVASGTGWGIYNDYYFYNGGTSMATPLTAGAAALVREYYGEAFGHTEPSAALLKATLINSAVDITGYGNTGQEAGKSIPNVHEGWGRVDVGAATSGEREFLDSATLGTGETGGPYSYYIGSSTIPLKITLVWSDYPGSPTAGGLVNNLDLEVTAPDGSTTYLGNVFSGGWSATGGLADSINNVESVYVQNPAIGQWTVEVTGFYVPHPQQPFALVVTGDFGPPPEPPIASFTGSPTSGEAPLTVSFSDLSSGDIDEWDWDFGDGDTSTLPNPTHEYAAAGDFTVSLTVTGPAGSDTHEEIDYIQVTLPPPPVADFSGSPTSGDALLNVSFTDESTGVITDWAWDFGDLGTSTLQDPSHIYKDVGDYTVSLTVTGPGGSDTETKSNYISVINPPKRTYLPLVLRAYAPPVPDDPIVNGDFEDGPWAGWIEYSFQDYPVVVNDLYAGRAPHSGSWLAWLGGLADENAYIEQTVAVPLGRSYLHYWQLRASSAFDCNADQASLLIKGLPVRTYDLCLGTNTEVWVETAVDLSAYVGQSVPIQFLVETSLTTAGSWFIDDVSFQVSAATADAGIPAPYDLAIPIARKVKPAPDLKP